MVTDSLIREFDDEPSEAMLADTCMLRDPWQSVLLPQRQGERWRKSAQGMVLVIDLHFQIGLWHDDAAEVHRKRHRHGRKNVQDRVFTMDSFYSV